MEFTLQSALENQIALRTFYEDQDLLGHTNSLFLNRIIGNIAARIANPIESSANGDASTNQEQS